MEQVLLSEDTLEAFQALKQACMNSPVLAFTDYVKDFLLEMDTYKEGIRSSSFPETSRWMVSSSSLWQLGTNSP